MPLRSETVSEIYFIIGTIKIDLYILYNTYTLFKLFDMSTIYTDTKVFNDLG